MQSGPLRGMVAIWNGGDKVVVYRKGVLGMLRLTFPAHDKFVTSMRGNTLASGDLGAALTCFAAHADRVKQSDGPQIEGVATLELRLDGPAALRCPGDSPKDEAEITRDAIYLSRTSHLPMRRVRFAGETLVEQWDLLDLRVNTGLGVKDF
jgi:hypothetical protein